MRSQMDEAAWIERKAAEYADQSGYIDSMAVALATEELERLMKLPKAEVIPIRQTPGKRSSG